MNKFIITAAISTLAIGLLAGCAMGVGETPVTEGPLELPITQPTETPDVVMMTGLFYRTTNGENVLLAKDFGGVILTETNELTDFNDFTFITGESSPMTLSFPAHGSLTNITPVEMNEDDMAQYQAMYQEMMDLGYKSQIWWPSVLEIVQDPIFESQSTGHATITTSIKITDKLAENNPNVLYSPMSLNYALGMAANGVDNAVAAEFERYFGMTIDEYNTLVQQYMSTRASDYENTNVEIANSIWVQDGAKINEEFERTVKDKYDAEVGARVFNANFINEVNDWCNEKTHGMIPSILDNGISEETAAILINALYFNSDWEEQYEEYQVRDTEFANSDGSVSIVDGMYESTTYEYLENDYAQGFIKPYEDERYAFVAILPKETGEFQLTDLDIEGLMETRIKHDVDTMIPTFDFANSFSLLTPLESAGFPVGTLRFTEIIDTPVFISDILQKTAIKVTPAGTTAAAVTAIMMDAMMAPIEDPQIPKEVFLNRPFAFMIYDQELQTPLFIGKVTHL